MVTWDPRQYGLYADERRRPFDDLVRRIGADSPRRVVDLGCGPGSITASLAIRWPGAEIIGIDSSHDMIEQASALAVAPNVRFELGDLRNWKAPGPVDVVLSNAALQWVPDHLELFEEFVSWLTPFGWLAFQVPGNFLSPSHRLLAELRRSPRWHARVGDGAERQLAVHDPQKYAEVLGGLGLRVDAWETTYLHLLAGVDPVLEWVKGTGLRPVIDALDGTEQTAFLAEYGAKLRAAYPARADGVTPFPFRRIFAVGQRRG